MKNILKNKTIKYLLISIYIFYTPFVLGCSSKYDLRMNQNNETVRQQMFDSTEQFSSYDGSKESSPSLFPTEEMDTMRKNRGGLLLDKMNKRFANLTNNLNDDYRKSLEQLDQEKIMEHMNMIKMLDEKGVTSKIKNHTSKYSTIYPEINIKDYQETKKELEIFAKKCLDQIVKTPLINENTKHDSNDRELYFKSIGDKVLFLQFLESNHLIRNENRLKAIENNIKEQVNKEIKKSEKTISNLQNCSEDDIGSINLFLEICNDLTNQSIAFKDIKEYLLEGKRYIVDVTKRKVKELENETQTLNNLSLIGDKFIVLQKITDNLVSLEDDLKLNQIIQDLIKSLPRGSIVKLSNRLSHDAIGHRLMSNYSVFKFFQNIKFLEKTKSRDINAILYELDGDKLDIKKLREGYDDYKCIYNNLIENFFEYKIKIINITNNVKKKCADIRNQLNFEWKENVNKFIPMILANICVIWTLEDIEDYLILNSSKNFLKCPHAAQIISILRILGYDSHSYLANHIQQIGTGMGKSVTMAFTSIILALFGYEVSCACYSDFLTTRDYNSFRELFDKFGVAEYIKYGTFREICENFINSDINVRDQIIRIVTGNTQSNKSKRLIQNKNPRPRILFIDEVDVFFQDQFYGSQYKPVASLVDPTINKLNEYIWKNRSDITLTKLYNSTEYKKVCKKFSEFKKLIREASKDMIIGAKRYNDHNPVIHEGKIGYKENDSINYTTRHGYKTQFKAREQYDQNKITKDTLNAYIAIYLSSGKFSYAEIPKKFKYILGVTGTLKSLENYEEEEKIQSKSDYNKFTIQKKIIQSEYNIKKFSYIPPLFDQSNRLIFKKDEGDIKIKDRSTYHSTIKQEIDRKLAGNQGDNSRAVLVVFEDLNKLNEFFDDDIFSIYRAFCQKLSPENSIEEKKRKIKLATQRGKVTLMTRDFARGCDFICDDNVVNSNGGMHLIQTFLSLDKSEEIQCMGRVARQSDPGSFSMILLDTSLEEFDISNNDIKNMKSYSKFYDFLDKMRNKKYQKIYSKRIKGIKNACEIHQKSEEFLNELKKGNIKYVKNYLINQNKGTNTSSNISRTIVAIDVTGSMWRLIEATKQTLIKMFELMRKALKQKGLKEDCFQLKFVTYRNYSSSYEDLLDYSEWSSTSGKLQSFLDRVKASGGCDPGEAVEVALQYSLRDHICLKHKSEPGIDQVILIGDAPSNTDSETDKHRRIKGEDYWSKHHIFKNVAHISKMIHQFAFQKIPIHCFYLKNYAKKSFNEIAHKTNGISKLLDIDSSDIDSSDIDSSDIDSNDIDSNDGAKKLMEVIATKVLLKAAGDQGKNTVNFFKEMLKKINV